MSSSLRKLLVALLALTLVAAACGSDGDSADSSATTAAPEADESEDAMEEDESEGAMEEDEAAVERGNVAYFSYANFNGFSQGIWTGVQAGAAEAGIEAEIFDGAFDFSGETQAQQIQNATLSGDFDTFVISSNNGAAITPAVQEAIAEGIAVVAVFSPIGPDQLTLDPQVDGLIFAGQSVIGSVEGQAGLVIEACADRDPCNVAYLAGDPTLDIDQTRRQASKASPSSASVLRPRLSTPSRKVVGTVCSSTVRRTGVSWRSKWLVSSSPETTRTLRSTSMRLSTW